MIYVESDYSPNTTFIIPDDVDPFAVARTLLASIAVPLSEPDTLTGDSDVPKVASALVPPTPRTIPACADELFVVTVHFTIQPAP